jgi:hypothetical protein
VSNHEQLFCPIRKEWVAALPEERVRQRILCRMIEEGGFPASLIIVEKGIRQLPHIITSDTRQIPDRRVDVACFAKEVGSAGGLYPLLAIECKAVPLTEKVIHQVVGYNHYIRACFISIANEHEVKTGWYDQAKNGYVFVDFLPSYKDLILSKTP